MCEAHSYSMLTLHDYIDNVIATYKNSPNDDAIDNVYNSLSGSLTPYYVLHLSDLNIDPYYVPGASVKCREFRCCHAKNNKIPQTDP